MTLAARRSPLSLVVHAVDDAGALCGARPARDWRLSQVLPVNCPKCLYALSVTRYAMCETPVAGSTSPIHIRVVGEEGIRKSGSTGRAKTLCGQVVGWDLGPLTEEDLSDRRTCRGCKLDFRNS